MARPDPRRVHSQPITVWVPNALVAELRAKAQDELGEMPARNGDAAVPTIVRRLIEAYVSGGGK